MTDVSYFFLGVVIGFFLMSFIAEIKWWKRDKKGGKDDGAMDG